MDQENGIERDDWFEHYKIIVDQGQAILRIDKYLDQRIANVSRSKIQAAAANECILVNKIAVKSNYKVRPGDVISIILPEPPRDEDILPENIPIEVVYEDNDLLVVNKKSGMVVHPAYANYTGTLVNALLYHLNEIPVASGAAFRPGLVHRIDKDTSGLLVVAKNEAAMTFLAKQFFDHSIERKYIALVWGDVKKNMGTIRSGLTRDPKNRKRIITCKEEEGGKLSITHYSVLERFGYTTVIECQLETGRTHQIRAHMTSLGHPLFNDELYGGSEIVSGPTFTKYKQFIQNCFKIITRQALHAKTLGFIHPSTKENVNFEVELPEDMARVLEKWRGASVGSR
jgi:23S rRNA pseudouridine1911/1915/1917 synthase